MGADQVDLSIVLKAILDAHGFEEAQAAIKGLVSSANSATGPTKGLGDATGDLAEKQKVSSREIKILTAEMLRSIGASEGAGSAGRLAAEGFAAIGNASMMTNAALAAVGFAIAFVLPRLQDLASGQESSKKVTEDFNDALGISVTRLQEVIDKSPGAARELGELLRVMKGEDTRKQSQSLQEMSTRMKEIRAEMGPLETTLSRYNATQLQGDNLRFYPEAAKAKKRLEELGQEAADLKVKAKALEEATLSGVSVDDEATAALGAHTLALKKDKEARDAAIKSMDFEAAFQNEQANGRQQELDDRMRAVDLAHEQDAQARKDMAQNTIFTKAQLKERRKAEDEYNKQLKRDHDQQAQWAHDDALQKQQATDAIIGNYAEAGAALATAFGNNKALAIAAAIVNTWAGADLALATYAYNPPLAFAMAAAIAAKGLANVVNIEKANPGFDDPGNDAVVRRFGRKWADDMAGLLNEGFYSRVGDLTRGAGSTGTTVYDQRTYHQGGQSISRVIVPGVVGAGRTNFYKNFQRQLDRIAGPIGRRTTLGRR